MEEVNEYCRVREVFRCYYTANPDMNLLRHIAISTGLNGLIRKLAWMAFLDILPSPCAPVWGEIIKVMRERYTVLIEELPESGEFDELIDQDIERLYSDVEFFMRDEVKAVVRRVCRLYAWKHPEVGYQQGIHELVGIIYMAYSEPMPDPCVSVLPFPEEYESTVAEIMKNGFIEHDTFVTLEHLISHMNPSFSNGALGVRDECNRMFDALKYLDAAMYDKLNEIGIIPTTFGVKWLRLLFSREFPLDQVLVCTFTL